MDNQPSPEEQPPQRRRFQYGLPALILLTTVACATAAITRYIMTAERAPAPTRATLIIAALAAPIVLMIVLSFAREAFVWWKRQR